MEYNPYTKEYTQLRKKIIALNTQEKLLRESVNWFDHTDVSRISFDLEEQFSTKNNYEHLIESIKKEIGLLNTKSQLLNEKIKTLFNPANWFNNEQSKLRKQLNDHKQLLSTKEAHKNKTLKSLSSVDTVIQKMQSDINRYKQFNRDEVNAVIARTGRDINESKQDFSLISDLKKNVDTELQPILAQKSEYTSAISAANNKITKAQTFEQELNSAANSYERAMIHEKCEQVLGESRPKKIISKQERSIRQLQRDIVKVEKRATQIGIKAARDIRKIIIDGNNMCYQAGKFVGLAPLLQITSELHKTHKLIVIFDAAIRSQMSEDDDSLRAKFKNTATVHIVATKQFADETILDLALDNSQCYILSNDRFGEYQDKEVVKSNRLIRHEIVNNKVIVHDLNVNSHYD